MKDEILYPYNVDNNEDKEAIPRYDIYLPSGEILHHGVQFILCNTIAEPGTPLNKQSLLRDATAKSLGLDPETATPDDALNALRAAIGFCPKLRVAYYEGGTITVTDTSTQKAEPYTMPRGGVMDIDLLNYSTFNIKGTFPGLAASTQSLNVDATKLYTLSFKKAQHYRWVFSSNANAQFTIKNTAQGITFTAYGKSATFEIPVAGTYQATIVYNGVTQTKSVAVTESDVSLERSSTINLTW